MPSREACLWGCIGVSKSLTSMIDDKASTNTSPRLNVQNQSVPESAGGCLTKKSNLGTGTEKCLGQ